jgi:putative ABC transport system ATP-binding protein
MNTILAIQGVAKHYGNGEDRVQALSSIDLTVRAGDFVAIMGASGSGKSTLLHLIGGLDLPDEGRILIENRDITRMNDRQRTLFRRDRLGIVFQAYNLLPTLSAAENIALPMLVAGAADDRRAARTRELLELLHLNDRASHRPAALSGGEQQRVAIARSLLNDPALILADEPTGNLDSIRSLEIWHLLARLAREMGKTVLMVTHEAEGAVCADRVIMLKDGRIVGELTNEGKANAALVATRYQELAG